ncbi:transmembrane amino acid transporter [Xylaria nigripes]|nr:transmembrane amino acid transporter [Xylaria nigripes]
MAAKQPAKWAEHEERVSPSCQSNSPSPVGNLSAALESAPLLQNTETPGLADGELFQRRRRRSSVTNTLAALTDIGGVNSIRCFSQSFQRAAGFPEIIPQRPTFLFAPGQEPLQTSAVEASNAAAVTDRVNTGPYSDSLIASDDRMVERKRSESVSLQRVVSPSNSVHSDSILSIPPKLFAPQRYVYGSTRSYGTIADLESEVGHASMREAAELWRQHRESGGEATGAERHPIFVKEVQQDGKIVLAVSGQSTLPQTIVNSTNVLIGIGMLSLPMGLKYSGWIIGLITLALCGSVTRWTAMLLAKCMDLDPTTITFSDIAFISFGKKARIATSFLFTLELLAACVAFIVLFADSLTLLFPGTLTVTQFKIVCTMALIPLQFAPLALLSVTSFVGIFCCLGIGIIVLLDGFAKQTTPGSLVEPAATHLFPANWLTIPLSFGLFMSPWGGHSVIPNIYRDMRHTQKFTKSLNFTFSFAMLVDASIAIAGFLMFGDDVREEITANMLGTTGYPDVLNVLLVIFIAVIPLTKVSLTAQPIITTIEVLFGLRQRAATEEPTPHSGLSNTTKALLRALVRVATLLTFLVISILFPAFDSIMAFMGSALCFTICVTLPLAFYLRLFDHEIGMGERILCWTVMSISLTTSIIGTVWAFLPKHLIGAE